MDNPKIGISMLYILAKPFDVMLKKLDTVNAEYVEVFDDGLHTLNKKRVEALNKAAKRLGIKFTLHCPIADINIASPSKNMLKASMKRLNQSMKYAQALDAELWVLHPGQVTGISPFYPDSDWKQNNQSIQLLHKTAKDLGRLRVAIENVPKRYGSIMKTPEDFARFYRETRLTDIGIVLDIGHANIEAQTEGFIDAFPDKIAHLHLSDNMGEHDQHLGIGSGIINWQQIAAKLKAIKFNGTIMVESVYDVPESLTKLKQLFA